LSINGLGCEIHELPSGKQTVCEVENGPVEIVDLPINHGNFQGIFSIYAGWWCNVPIWKNMME